MTQQSSKEASLLAKISKMPRVKTDIIDCHRAQALIFRLSYYSLYISQCVHVATADCGP